MKKYQILIAGLLLSVSCMNETERSEQNNRDFRVTAIIENTDTMSRVADRNDRTTFTEGDAILIGGAEVLLTNIAIRERIVHLLRMPLPTGSYGRGY